MRDANHDAMGSEGAPCFDAHGDSISPDPEGMLCRDLRSDDNFLMDAELSDLGDCSIGSTQLLGMRSDDAGVALDPVTVASPEVAMGQDLYSDTWGAWAQSATVVDKECVLKEVKRLFDEYGNIW